MKNSWPFSGVAVDTSYDASISWPLISIVTPSYNQGGFIEETILSIINQGYPNLEFIIMDAGSNDDTVSIIKKYEKHIKYWVSEPDKGQADAINKGFKKCTGKIFNWVNSDDYLPAGTLKAVAEAYLEGYGIIAGEVINFSDTKQEISKNQDLELVTFLSGKSGWHQPGVWVNLEKVAFPELDMNRHYCFDYKMMVDILKQSPSVKYLQMPFMYFRLHNDSKTINNGVKNCNEYIGLLKELRLGFSDKEIRRGIDSHIHFFSKLVHCNILIEQVLSDSGKSNRSKVFSIIQKMITKPKYCFNRYSVGALRSILLQTQKAAI